MMKIKNILTKKRIIYGVIVAAILVAVYFIFFNKKNQQETLVVHPSDFLQQVSASGKITARENLNLSFEQSGQVSGVYVKIGDTVKPGQLLANQNTSQLDAQLAEMRAGLNLQKAKLNQLLAGSSQEDIVVAKTVLLNAHQAMVNTLQDGYTKANDAVFNKTDQMFFNPQGANPKVIFFTTNSQLKSNIELKRLLLADMFKAWQASLISLDSQDDLAPFIVQVKENINQVKTFVDKLSIIVNDPNSCVWSDSGTCISISSAWKTDISTAATNLNASLGLVISDEGDLKNAQSQLELAKAPARDSDIAVYQAQIEQADAQAQNVLAQLQKRKIYSPIDGIVTAVPVKIGSVFSANETAVSLISNHNFQVESYVPEVNISLVKVGQKAKVELDSYVDTFFDADVASIDPAETIKDGVSSYRVVLEFGKDDQRIKSGMTGTIIVTTLLKSNVISVPQKVVTVNNDGTKFVKIKQGESIIEREVEIGSLSSLGNIEIVSGLSDGDTVIVNQ